MTARVLVVVGSGRVDPAAPLLRADDLGVLRGESVFETALVVDRRALLLTAHLDRFTVSAQRIDLRLPERPRWHEAVATALEDWDDRPGVLRLVCTKGPDDAAPPGGPVGFALLTPVPEEVERQRRDGVHAMTLTLGVGAGVREQAPWLLGGVKSTSYATNMAALRTAHDAGAEDVVHVSTDGQVLEGPTSSVVLALGETLVTPPPEVGILPGTTVAALLRAAAERGLATEVRPVGVEELRGADAAWLTSSVRLLARLRTLDGAAFDGGGTVLDRIGIDAGWTP